MSTLKVIEKATLSLPRDDQQRLLSFLTAILHRDATSAPAVPAPTRETSSASLHPDLVPVVGIIPAGADADGIHEHRLLKHS